MRIALSELLIAKEDGRTTVRVFTAQPTPLEEKNLGRIFALMEIDSQDSVNDSILEMIADEVNTQFYRSEATEVEGAFESALQKTNAKLHELTSQLGDEWLESLHVVIGVQKGRVVVFTHLGRLIALMVHNGRMVDIVQPTHMRASDINPAKIFSTIVSGTVSEHSILFFGTESILDYISKEKIKRLVVDSEPDQVSEQLRSLLEEDTTNTNFAAIVFKAEAAPTSATDAPTIRPADPIGSTVGQRDSMFDLLGKQSRTTELLSSSIWPGVRKSLQSLLRGDGAQRQTNHGERGTVATPHVQQQSRTVRAQPAKAGSSVLRIVGMCGIKLLTLLKSAVMGIISVVGRGVRTLHQWIRRRRQPSYGNQRTLKTAPSRKASSWISRGIQWFRSLTTVQKIFFIVAIVVFLIFAQSIVNRGGNQINDEQEQQYAQAISNIDLKINEGKAAILYDREKAREVFMEARTLLSGVPKESEAYTARGAELDEVIRNQLKIVNNVITLDQPSPVIDYSTLGSDIHVNQMILLGASLYGFDQSNTSVYRGNLENQEESATIRDAVGGKTVSAVAKASPGTGAVALSDGSFAIFNPVTEALEPLDLQYENSNRQIVDIQVFGVRLYTLDVANNQIFRHQKNDEGFAAGTGWISDSTVNLANATSFTIDGDIWVLEKSGTVIKLSNGSRADFTLSSVDPALTSAERIFTDENASNLYLLDRTQKRVVVFGKDGKLVAQYTSDAFSGMSDFVVDEANKKMYVLSDSKVYAVDLQ